MTEFIALYTEQIIGALLICFYFGLDFLLKKKMGKLKKSLDEKYKIKIEDKNLGSIEQEDQLAYYKLKNFLSFVRFGVLFTLCTFYILHKLPNFFSIFAVAVGTIIIVFKDLILCFVGFFYISTQYKIGDNILITEGSNSLKGEIIYINILNIGLIGKDSNGEHNGQFYRFPNHKFFSDIIKKEEIGIDNYKKEELKIYFSSDKFSMDLSDFVLKLQNFLNELIPKRNTLNSGNYKTFIGHKYKLRFEQIEDKLYLKLSFIEKPKNIFNLEKSIYSFVESCKIKEKDKKNDEK